MTEQREEVGCPWTFAWQGYERSAVQEDTLNCTRTQADLLVPHLVSKFWYQELCNIPLEQLLWEGWKTWAGGRLNEGSLWVFWRTSSWRLFARRAWRLVVLTQRHLSDQERTMTSSLFPKILAMFPGFLPLSLPIPEALILVEMERTCEGTSWEGEWDLKMN